MKLYQKEQKEVKESIQILDTDALVECASKGLLNLSVQLGLEVVRQLMDEEVVEHAGAKGKHDPNRTAFRHGTEATKVVLGGGKMSTKRPRIRDKEGGEIPLTTLELFQNEDCLNQSILSKLLSGVSCRKYVRTVDAGDADITCASKSEVSRRFTAGMDALMNEFFNRPIVEKYPAILMDGLVLGKMTIVAAMGIDADGKKRVLGLVEGGSENSEVVKSLLEDLVQRGLSQSEPRLFVLDGGKALHKAVKDMFSGSAVIQRCQVHKKRNVLDHLPQSEQGNVSIMLTNAYREFEYDKAKARLERLINYLEHRYPKAADSLREGLEETLTVHRLEVPGLLRQTLSSTNAMESANSACKGVIRRVSHFKNGATVLRHAAAGFMEAEKGFRRIKGYRQLPLLMNKLNSLTNIKEKGNIGIA